MTAREMALVHYSLKLLHEGNDARRIANTLVSPVPREDRREIKELVTQFIEAQQEMAAYH